MVGTVSSCRNNNRGKAHRVGGGGGTDRAKTKRMHAHTIEKNKSTHTHVFASRPSVWLLLTVVPGHSVPEAETCRVLHRCGWSVLQCAWAPGHREDGGSEAEKHAGETKLTWAERVHEVLKIGLTFTLLSSAGAWLLHSSSSFSGSGQGTAASGVGQKCFKDCAPLLGSQA